MYLNYGCTNIKSEIFHFEVLKGTESTGGSLPEHYPLIFLTFLLTLKCNTIQCNIQNKGKTPLKNKYRKLFKINTALCALFLQIV